MPRPYLVGIAGPSCSGKSELSRRLARALGAEVLALDSYYVELAHLPLEERAKCNFDQPEALDHGLLAAQLAALTEGRSIDKPIYDFARHTRAPQVETVHPGEFLIVEGLFALYWEEIRSLMGTRVFMDASDEVCLARRIERDIRERGRTRESVLEQYRATVRPMAEQYILPTRRFADVVVSGVELLERTSAAVLAHIRSARGGRLLS